MGVEPEGPPGERTQVWTPGTPATEPPAAGELAPEAVLAQRFRIVRFLGRGGMGDVYEAADLELGERVALKTIRPEIAHYPGALERFRREIQLARKVTHRNVCRIFDVFHHRLETRLKTPLEARREARPEGAPAAADGEISFFTMELLPGETLQERLRRRGPMREGEALPIVRQMAAGLAAAHRAGVVHRDFKSANVMLAPEAEGVRVAITDFGLARGGAASAGLTVRGDFLGTPEYMSPEQVTGGEITPATDVYALGVVLYEMVTGALPFVGDTALSTAAKRLSVDPPPPRAQAPDLDPAWEAAILRCLERRPEERFTGAEEAAAALDPATPAAAGARRPPRRKWWRVAAAAVGALAIAWLALLLAANHLARQAFDLRDLGRYDEAITKLNRAKAFFAWIGLRDEEWQTQGNLGVVIGLNGDREKGLDLVNESLSHFESTKDQGRQALELVKLGTLYQDIPDREMTRSSYSRAIDLAKEAGDDSLQALALFDLGTARFAQDDPGGAYSALRDALAIQLRQSENAEAVGTRIYLGEALLELGRPVEAADSARRAAEEARRAKDTPSEAEAGALLARIRLRQSDLRAAQSELDKIERLAQISQDAWIRGVVALAAGRVLAAQGRVPEAVSRLQAALSEVKGLATIEPDLQLALGEIEVQHGDRRHGRELLETVQKYARQHGLDRIAVKAEKALAGAGPP